jgi:hypothetical protein
MSEEDKTTSEIDETLDKVISNSKNQVSYIHGLTNNYLLSFV